MPVSGSSSGEADEPNSPGVSPSASRTPETRYPLRIHKASQPSIAAHPATVKIPRDHANWEFTWSLTGTSQTVSCQRTRGLSAWLNSNTEMASLESRVGW